MVELEDGLNAKVSPRTYAELMTRDVQISGGYAHAGYPYQCSWNWHDPFVLDQIKATGRWGDFHELGHNHQEDWWTRSGDTEVTVNLFSNYVMEELCPAAEGEWTWTKDPAEVWRRAQKLFQAGNAYADVSVDDQLLFYLLLSDRFGWDAYKQFFASYRNDNRNDPAALPANDQEKLDQLLVRFSKAVERDLSSYAERWGLALSKDVIKQLDDLKKWDPFELYLMPEKREVTIGESMVIHLYVPAESSKVTLLVNGSKVVLKKLSDQEYTYVLKPKARGTVKLFASVSNGAKDAITLQVN